MTKTEFLELSIDEQISAYNDWCEEEGYMDDLIYSNDDLNELLQGLAPIEIAQKVQYGDYNCYDEYVTFDGYANLKSINDYDIEDYILDRMEFEEE